MNFLFLFMVVVIVLALCFLGLGLGVMIKNKTFTSCGNASITYKGEKIKCPACLFREGEDPPEHCERRSRESGDDEASASS